LQKGLSQTWEGKFLNTGENVRKIQTCELEKSQTSTSKERKEKEGGGGSQQGPAVGRIRKLDRGDKGLRGNRIKKKRTPGKMDSSRGRYNGKNFQNREGKAAKKAYRDPIEKASCDGKSLGRTFPEDFSKKTRPKRAKSRAERLRKQQKRA